MTKLRQKCLLITAFFGLALAFSLFFQPTGARADNVGCGFSNLLYPTYMGTDGGTATCSSATQCLGYYFKLTTESDVSINFTQGASNCTLNLYKKADYDHSLAKAWMKPSYSGRLATGDWRIEACPLRDLPFKLVVTAAAVSSGASPGAPTKKSNGESCSAASECSGGYCVWSKCRSSGTYCGDSHCDSGESCSSCSADCGSCAAVTKNAGEVCTGNSDCESTNCVNWVCCDPGKRCCSANSQCTSGQQCKMDYGYYYCIAKKVNSENCSSAADCLGGYCNSGTCASESAAYCGDGVCNSDESCSSCSSDCGSCYTPPAAYCGDGSCGSDENCSSCSSDCRACEKQIVIMEMKVASVVKIKDTGSATEQIKYIFPADVWEKNLKQTPLTAKYLNELSKQITNMLKGSGMDVKSAKASADKRDRALIFDIVYNKYAAKGADKIWSAPVLGKSMSFGSSCSPENVTGSFQGDHLVVQANCESTTISTATAELRTKIIINQSVYLLGNISHAEYVNGNPMVTYKVLPITYKEGHSCSDNDECKSGNCLNKICCIKGKTCCTSTKQCPVDEYCSVKNNRNFCIPSLPDGQSCQLKDECRSGNCKKGICCGFGQNCCQKQGDCKKGEYCSSEEGWKYACRMQWQIGEKCTESAMCKSGFCDSENWTCENKSAPVIPAALAVPSLIFLKKGETAHPLITIQNTGRKDIELTPRMEIVSSDANVVSTDGKTALELPTPKTLPPGGIISTKSKQAYDTIEDLTLTGQGQGVSRLTFRTVYKIEGQSKEITATLMVVGSDIHVDQDADATALFGTSMLLEEKRSAKDTKTGKTKEYIFVAPEKGRYMGTGWQEATDDVFKYLSNLADDFTGPMLPDAVGFYSTVKGLAESKTQKELTEKAFRAAAPPSFFAGYDATGLFEAMARQMRIEKGFLELHKAKELIYIPIYDSAGKRVGSSKAIVKVYKGKNYAVKLGDL